MIFEIMQHKPYGKEELSKKKYICPFQSWPHVKNLKGPMIIF